MRNAGLSEKRPSATRGDAAIAIPVTYQQEWRDGFGARGWKLDVALGEPSVIAATAEHGTRIPTSVLVHDILDHHLCGFAIGGHRNEAMALMQLASRTGADPRQDYRQIVTEDLLRGHCNGESLSTFLPPRLIARVPADRKEGKAMIDHLRAEMGDEALSTLLVQRFVEIGTSVQRQVEAHWRSLGLDYQRRGAMGLALQGLLERLDADMVSAHRSQAHGRFIVANRECSAVLDTPATRPITAAVA